MHMPHLALFMNSLMLGGAERVVLSVVRGLARRAAFRLDVVLVSRKGPLVAEIPDGVRVVELGCGSPLTIWPALLRLPWETARSLPGASVRAKMPAAARCLPRLVRYLREERPDALFTTLRWNNIAALWAAALAGGPTRVVIREANMPSIDISSGAHGFDRLLPEQIRSWYPRAHGIVAVSEGVARDLAAFTGLEPGRITAIHNPVDIDRVGAMASEPVAEEESAEDGWFSPGAPPVIVAVGRLWPQKDYSTLLRAFARLAAERPARLVILGEGPERPALEQLAASLGIVGRVRLPGAVSNPFAYVRRAGAFALSSAWEGFPNVLVEALACGCPVVSTDCPSGPDELLEGGRWGSLVPVGDDAALARALSATLDAPRDSERLQQRAGAFSLDGAVDRYLDLLLGRPA